MTTIKLCLSGATARAIVDGPITHGMVGVQAKIQWDEAWDALVKTLKVHCANVCRTAVVSEDGTAMIPYECLIAGQWLAIGLDGWDADGTLRIPSSWASCGVVKSSVAQCDGPEGAPPTVDTVAQLQILVGRAESAAGELSDAAAAAANSASDADKSAREAKEALDKTSEIAVNTPYIGANGNWIVWDAARESYVDSGVRAVGNDANVTADNINKALGFTPADVKTVNQLKNDLPNKLPKSPANWEPWTAEEQAAARERMNAHGSYKHIATITIDEDGVYNVGIDRDENGMVFSVSDVYIYGYMKKTAAIPQLQLRSTLSSQLWMDQTISSNCHLIIKPMVHNLR